MADSIERTHERVRALAQAINDAINSHVKAAPHGKIGGADVTEALLANVAGRMAEAKRTGFTHAPWQQRRDTVVAMFDQISRVFESEDDSPSDETA